MTSRSGEIKREKKNKESYAGGYSACGAGDAVRRMVSPLLGCRRNGAGALRHSSGGQSSRRRPGVVSRSIRQSSDYSESTARIAELRWSMAISKTADCAALITAGCSTSRANVWKCRRSRRTVSFRQKVKHLSYPVKELGGLLFAYMGPDQDDPPPLPNYAPLVDRGGQWQIEPVRQADYNWFNFFENSADPAHVCILHRHAGYGQQSWGNQFFSYTEMPHFEFVEMDYGMKVVMTKPGPKPGTEFVDEMSLALPSIVQVGDTEFVHAKLDAAALIKEGSQCEHWMFVTPNDDDHFMLFTADNYTGPEANFFEKLKELRAKETPMQEVMPYDKRKFMPFKGNVRKEDLMTQGTQGLLGERSEQLGVSDRGVIKFRKIVLDAIETALNGGRPKGTVDKKQANEIVSLGNTGGSAGKNMN